MSINSKYNQFKGILHRMEKMFEASFEVALLIARDKKSDTIGESLVLPAAIKVCQILHGGKIADPVKSITTFK